MSLYRRLLRLVPSPIKRVVRHRLEVLLGRQANERTDNVSELAVLDVAGFQVAYRRGTADEDVLKHSFDDDIFFKGMPEYSPEPDDIIIDVGAHIGTFSLLASSKAGRGRVFSVEASADTYNFLRINAALNPSAPITPINVALSDADGVVALHHDSGNWGHSIVKALSARSEVVRSQTLRSFLAQHKIERCALIKFNCEGAEFPILLSSSRETLSQVHRMLVLYHSDLWEHNTETDLVSFLEGHGFACSLRNVTEMRGWIYAHR